MSWGSTINVVGLIRNEQIRDEIGLDDDQIKEIYSIHAELCDEIRDDLPLLAIGGTKSKIEGRFHEFEDEICSLLSTEQLDRLQQARWQLAAQRFGLDRVVSTEDFQTCSGLNSEGASELQDQVKQLHDEKTQQKKMLVREFNLEFLKRLDADDEQLLADTMKDDFEARFLETELFVDDRRKAVSFGTCSAISLSQMLKKDHVKELGLTDEQVERIRDLGQVRNKNEFCPGVEKILSANQMTKFDRIAITALCDKGTANAIVFGPLADQLGIDTSNRKELLTYARELDEDLDRDCKLIDEDFKNRTAEVIREQIGADLLGQPIDFE